MDPKRRDNPETPAPDDLTLRQFQEFIRRRYYETDRRRGTPATFLWFVEEVGELATALAGDREADKHEEFADVLAWLCTLANINDVDLTAALRKYTVHTPEGHK